MEANWGYPGEITSAYVNQGCDHDIPKPSKKRKFLSEVNEHFRSPASKYICCETLVEHGPFSKEFHQAKVFYPRLQKEKMSLEETDGDIGADSTQGSSITVEDSFSMLSHIKPDVNGEDELDEFGHCLEYLVSACDNDSKEQMDEEFEDFLNGMAPKLGQVSREPTIDQEFEEYFSTLML